jgi:hypothetical protein
MHVFLRAEPVQLRMVPADAQGLVPEGSDLVPMAFYVNGNDQPSFRSLLPPETEATLGKALSGPVILGVLAEEPDDPSVEVRAMIGIAVPMRTDLPVSEDDQEDEPWRASAGDVDAWRGETSSAPPSGPDGFPAHTALLAFAPLVRLQRKFPLDFAQELADLLETALAGATRPALEARVDRMLEDL